MYFSFHGFGFTLPIIHFVSPSTPCHRHCVPSTSAGYSFIPYCEVTADWVMSKPLSSQFIRGLSGRKCTLFHYSTSFHSATFTTGSWHSRTYLFITITKVRHGTEDFSQAWSSLSYSHFWSINCFWFWLRIVTRVSWWLRAYSIRHGRALVGKNAAALLVKTFDMIGRGP